MTITTAIACNAKSIRSARRLERRTTFMALVVSLAGFFATLMGAAHAQDLSEIYAVNNPASTETVDHSAFAALLDSYLVASDDGVNRFRYGAVTADDRAALKTYIGSLAQQDVPTLNRSEQFAFWANLYNAITLDVVLDAYPVKSIRQIKPTLISIGPWKKGAVMINGRSLSLDDIEHGILRKIWSDPRVHYSVNCASIGCPNLRPRPFSGGSLEADLDAAARDFINHPRGASVKNGKLTVSSIYKWFQSDFGGSDAGVIAHFRKYANPELAGQLEGVTKISADSYDWALNEIQ